MIVGARQGGLSISEIAHLLGFSHATVSRVAENGAKSKRVEMSAASYDANASAQ